MEMVEFLEIRSSFRIDPRFDIEEKIIQFFQHGYYYDEILYFYTLNTDEHKRSTNS